MKKIAINYFWSTISTLLIILHVIFLFNGGRYQDSPSYTIGLIAEAVIFAYSLYYLREYMQRNSVGYSEFASKVAKTIWYWTYFFAIFVCLKVAFFLLGQLFLDKDKVYDKLSVGGSHYNGCILGLVFTTMITVILFIHVQKKMIDMAK